MSLLHQHIDIPSGNNRYWGAIAAQTGGLVLLVVLGVLVFPNNQNNIVAGLNYIQRIIGIYIIGSLIGAMIPSFFALLQRRPEVLRHMYVDYTIWFFVWMDINLLLFLVCQEAGLCRSMFHPVFLLIPIAYLAVERPNRRYRSIIVLMMIISYMIISYYMSDLHRLTLISLVPTFLLSLSVFVATAVEGIDKRYRLPLIAFFLIISTIGTYYLRDTDYLPSLSVPTTDFHSSAHPGFDKALFISSLISAIIPFVQIILIMYQNRKILQELNPPDATASENARPSEPLSV